MLNMQPIGDVGGGDRRLRPHNHQALKCPRCDSLNTKFCYYNNYNLSQPRHFCKSCRRYWTKGGVLRSVPVGGGCRKNKRSKPKTERKSAAQSSSSETTTDSPVFSDSTVNPNQQPLVDGQIFSSLMTSSEFGISYGRDQPLNHVLVAGDQSSEFKLQDWGAGGDQDFFDLTAEVDPSYWNQSEWDNGHHQHL